ncbi:uncharacterized protein [Musca autumnalis]|uniref:uncharacterized protein n=1 Tax=Musca autumnalis TaxID=221902 RepID=UPI003CF4D91B
MEFHKEGTVKHLHMDNIHTDTVEQAVPSASRENLYSSDQQQHHKQQTPQQQQQKHQRQTTTTAQQQQHHHHSHQQLLRQSLINLSGAQNAQSTSATLSGSHSDNNSYCSANTSLEPEHSSSQQRSQEHHQSSYLVHSSNQSRSPGQHSPLQPSVAGVRGSGGGKLHKSISCSCESLKCAESASLAGGLETPSPCLTTSDHCRVGGGAAGDNFDTKTTKSLSRNFRDSTGSNGQRDNNEFSLDPSQKSISGSVRSSSVGQQAISSAYTTPSSTGDGDRHSLPYGEASGLRLSKQTSYDSSNGGVTVGAGGHSPQLLSLADARYCGQPTATSATTTTTPGTATSTANNNKPHQHQSHQYLESTSPTASRLSYSPNSKSSSLAIADADYQDAQQSGDFTHLVVHNFSNSDPIHHHQLDDLGQCPASLLKTHYSDVNIYSKNELDSHASQPDKQQLVNKAYIFKCIGNSPSFLKTNKIKDQSRSKLRNLSLKTNPSTGKKKSQILSKSNAVSDNSLHPGDKYLNLYLVEKKQKQQQQQQQQQQSSAGSASVTTSAGHHPVSRHSAPFVVNGAVKSSYPTYRSSIKSETAVSAALAAVANPSPSAVSVAGVNVSSLSDHPSPSSTAGGQVPGASGSSNPGVRGDSVNYLSSAATAAAGANAAADTSTHKRPPKPAKINNKGCNLVNNGTKLSVSTNSCNRLHAGSPHAISPKSSVSSNGHLNKYCLTDISRRKTEFNRQLSAPTDYTHHSSTSNGNGGSHHSQQEVGHVGASTSTVASAAAAVGLKSSAAHLSQQSQLQHLQQQQQSAQQLQQQQQHLYHQHQFHPHPHQHLLQHQHHYYQHSQQHLHQQQLPPHHTASTTTVLTKPTSNSCTNSFNRRHIKRQKNTKLNERLLRRDSEDSSVRCSYCSVLNVNENDLRRSFENTCTDSLVTAFDDEALLICDQGNEMVHFDDVSLYGTPKEEPMPSIPIVSEKVSANFLKSQLQSWFQPTDNRLAMKLFGSRKALVKERIRQKTSGHWVIHPCSSFR